VVTVSNHEPHPFLPRASQPALRCERAWSAAARRTQHYPDVLPETATAQWVHSFGATGGKSVVQLKKKGRGVDSVEHCEPLFLLTRNV